MEDQYSLIIIDLDEISDLEVFSAWAHFFEAESIIEQEEEIHIYCQTSAANSMVEGLAEKMSIQPSLFHIEAVKSQNWNSVWESNFDTIQFDDWLIRAEFHEERAHNEIIIKPQMAFGTGHHETTFMMLKYMNSIDLSSKRILDYGCGTGILAIFAAMKNASFIDAIDIQAEAKENTLEHIELNKIDKDVINADISDIETYSNNKYDIILANINRHVLEAKAEKIYYCLNESATLIMSGILKTDESLITERYINIGLNLITSSYRGEWCLFVFQK